MKVGIIGVGVVGGTLQRWFAAHTKHTVVLLDPPQGLHGNLSGCEHIFVSVPVPADEVGQDLSLLSGAIAEAKRHTQNVYIRSTVLPGTNNHFGTHAMPEFLTERRSDADFRDLPIVVGGVTREMAFDELFPGKQIIQVSNLEAEIAKFAHNCFGAMKVTYFNIINEFVTGVGADYQNVLRAANITGFLGEQHMQVPGPDGKYGYGGKCFPENIKAFENLLKHTRFNMQLPALFIHAIKLLNDQYRTRGERQHGRPVDGDSRDEQIRGADTSVLQLRPSARAPSESVDAI